MRAKSKILHVSDNEFINIVKCSNSYSECLRKLGLKTGGGKSSLILKIRINQLNIDVKHFIYGWQKSYYEKYTLDSILTSNSTYQNISCLKKTHYRK